MKKLLIAVMIALIPLQAMSARISIDSLKAEGGKRGSDAFAAIDAMTLELYAKWAAIDTEAELKTLYNLEPGVHIQAYSANLDTFAALAPSLDVLAILGAADYAAIRSLLDIEPSTITADTTDPTKAAVSILSESSKTLSPDKVPGVPSINFLYEANGTDTNGFGFLGPLNSSKNILYRISDESPAYGNVLTVDSVVADQTITVGGGSMVADVVTLVLADESGASGFTSFPTYKDSTGTKGQYAVNDAGTLLAMCVDSNSWRTVALSDTLSLAPTTPTLTSLTIPTSGDTATAVFSKAVSYGAGGAGGWTLNSPTNAMTYASGTGTDTIVFNLASTILSTDTPTVSYTQPTNGFESADDGVDLALIPNASVTNNSTQTGVDYSDILFYWGAENSSTADKPDGLTATTSTLTYQSSPKLVGSYSAKYTSNTYDRVQWSNTADAIFDRDGGRVGFWITTGSDLTDDNVYFESYYDASNYVRVRNEGADGLEVLWRGNGVTHQAYFNGGFTTSTAYYVEFSYGSSISMWVNGSEKTLTKSGAYTAMTSATANGIVAVGSSEGIGSAPAGASYDQLFISNDSARDLYVIREVTNVE